MKSVNMNNTSFFYFFNDRATKIFLVLVFIYLLFIGTFIIFPHFYLQKFKSSEVELITDTSIVSLTYQEYNLTQSRYDALYNYLWATNNGQRGVLYQPIRQMQLLYSSFPFLSTNILHGNIIPAYKTLLLLEDYNLYYSFAEFYEFIEYIVSRLEKGIEIKDYLLGPLYLWDYYQILNQLGISDRVPRERWIEMLLNAYNSTDGTFRSFFFEQGGTQRMGVQSIRYCKNAYFMLRELNALDRVNWTKTTEFILQLQHETDRLFQEPYALGAGFLATSVAAYSFFNASKQLDLIDTTFLQDRFLDFYYENLFDTDAQLLSILSFLVDFVLDNGYEITEFFPLISEVVEAILYSQNLLFGGFPSTWNRNNASADSSFVTTILSTYHAIKVLDACDSIHLLTSENITIVYPPLSSYTLNPTMFAKVLFTLSYLVSSMVITLLVVLIKVVYNHFVKKGKVKK